MSRITLYLSAKDIELLKQSARKLKRKLKIPHHEALDAVARQIGLNHWKHVCERAEALKAAEHAYYFGCVIAMRVEDVGSGLTHDGTFIQDSYVLEAMCKNDLFEDFCQAVNQDDEEGRTFQDSLSARDLNEYFYAYFTDLIFFRLSPTSKARTRRQVLRLVRTRSFWPPVFLWLQGELHNTYGEPVMDDSGQLVGLRL